MVTRATIPQTKLKTSNTTHVDKIFVVIDMEWKKRATNTPQLVEYKFSTIIG